MCSKILIDKQLSKKILTLGVSKKTKGGMASVVAIYDLYFDHMRYISTWKLSNKFIKLIFAVRALIFTFFLLLFDYRIKIVHIHVAANASFDRKALFIKMAKSMGRKVILHMHAADFEQYYDNSKKKEFILRTINICDKLIVLSNTWFQYFHKIGISKKKIEILNNVVSTPQLKPIDKKNDKINLLFLGEIGNRKGIFDLLKAIIAKKEFYRDKISLRIGGNEVEGNINSIIKKERLESFVFFDGWVKGDKKTWCFNWADVFILPSYNEGLPIAVLEAMSYSLPIISTPVGGIPEVVIDGENGFLVQPGNLKQIKDALEKFIHNHDLIQLYGEKSYQAVQAFFPESVFRQLKRIYQSLL